MDSPSPQHSSASASSATPRSPANSLPPSPSATGGGATVRQRPPVRVRVKLNPDHSCKIFSYADLYQEEVRKLLQGINHTHLDTVDDRTIANAVAEPVANGDSYNELLERLEKKAVQE